MGSPAIITAQNANLDADYASWPADLPSRNTLVMDDPSAPNKLSGAPKAPVVLAEWRPNRWKPVEGVNWTQIDRPLGPADSTCTLTVALDYSQNNQTRHYAYWLNNLKAANRIRVYSESAGGRFGEIWFQGYPMVHTLNWTERGDAMTIQCTSEGQEFLRTTHECQVYGRYMRARPTEDWDAQNSDAVLLPAFNTHFNAGGLPNRTPSAWSMETGRNADGDPASATIYLWTTDNGYEAKYWTYAQALRTLVYFWVLNLKNVSNIPVKVAAFLKDTEGIEDQPSDSNDPFVKRLNQRVDDVAIQATNVDQALALLCDAAGVHYDFELKANLARRPPTVEYLLRVFAPITTLSQEQSAEGARRFMTMPAGYDLPRPKPFKDQTNDTASEIASAGAAQKASLTYDHRDANKVIILGGVRTYEVSLLLRPLWAPHDQLDNLSFDEEGNPLTEDDYEDAKQAAKDFWRDEFPIVAGFDGDTGQPNSQYHGQHPDHGEVSDVFRLWGFPDSDEYYDEGYGRDDGPYDDGKYDPFKDRTEEPWRLWYEDPKWGGWIRHRNDDGEWGCKYWVPRRRPFLDTIGRLNADTSETAPIVRLHFGVRDADGDLETETDSWTGRTIYKVPEPNDDDWIRFTGGVDIDKDRGALRFIDDNFFNSDSFRADPGNSWSDLAIDAYIEGHLWVQVTCCIHGDTRLEDSGFSLGIPGATAPRVRVRCLDTGAERYRYRMRRGRTVAGNSFLWSPYEPGSGDDIDAYDNQDDSAEITKYMRQRLGQITGVSMAGDLELFFLTNRYNPGDYVTGCDGLSLYWFRYPVVERVQYINGPGMRTRLILTDLRHHPEIGGE